MNGPDQRGEPPGDPAAASRSFGPSFGYLVIAVLVVAGAVVYWLAMPDSEQPPTARYVVPPVAAPVAQGASWPGATAGPAASAASTAPAPVSSLVRAEPPERDGDLTPDLRSYLNPGENPSMGEVLDRLHRAGVYTGVGAFSPPGTSPPLVGLVVPEDFVLPEGYVRHYQTTDDGQSIEPILMYAPERSPAGAAGRPMPTVPSRVVPPELAPPGLPLRRVVIPPPVAADPSGK